MCQVLLQGLFFPKVNRHFIAQKKSARLRSLSAKMASTDSPSCSFGPRGPFWETSAILSLFQVCWNQLRFFSVLVRGLFQLLSWQLSTAMALAGVSLSMLLCYNDRIMTLKVHWKSNSPPSWASQVLNSSCFFSLPPDT